MRLEYLKKKLNKLTEKRESLTQKGLASDDVNEIRSINEQLEDIKDEIEDVKAEIECEEQRTAEINSAETREIPANAVLKNGEIKGQFQQTVEVKQTRDNEDMYASMEYRMAFKHYAQSGQALPEKFQQRDAANTHSLGATIPTTVLNEFINEIREVYGNLYRKVRKMNIQGAVKVPISKLQANFTWITESAVSKRQDGGSIDEFVEFSYNMAEIRVSQTLLSSIVSLDIFEREIVRIMMIAYMKAMDEGIVKGTGIGQMLGILNDPRVTNTISMTANDFSDWTAWRKKFFAKLPLGYRSGEFIFPLSTVDSYLETMADNNNNPIFRQATGLDVNDGDRQNPNGRFFGREISLVEPTILPDFDDAKNGDVVGIFWQPEEYAINTNMEFGMRRWFDEERNEWVNKILTVVDGKVLNPVGFYKIVKSNS